MDTDPFQAHRANRLLATLSPQDARLLMPHVELVDCEHRTILMDAGERIARVYFPHSAVICLVAVMRESGIAETATIGPEGLVGLEVLLGGERATSRTLVQVPGVASVIPARMLRKAMEESPSLRALLLRYVGAFLVQVSQSVACNSLHKVEERCCRWLLMAHDRVGRDSFPLTQEFMADLLGVHRPTVTIVARTLQAAGLIRYSRGVITIVDRRGLEQSACECYGIVRQAFEEILSFQTVPV
jgi:CRP-like cAMP-binding protein